jgi:hypothetical protein
MVNIPGATVGSRLGPLALVIGITGHRDLRAEDCEALEGQVRAVFDELRGRYRDTPLILLSPLAEGADRLAARVALACDVRLIVPLPLPRTLYESDFDTPASLTEFNELLHRAEGWFELPLLPGNTEEKVGSSGEHRGRQYAYAGAYIARHSQVLVALWDGEASDAEGGTAQIVRFKVMGVPEHYALAEERSSPLDPVDSGPVYHIMTPRASTLRPMGIPFSICKLFPQGFERDALAQASYERIYARMNAFNQDAMRLESALTEECETSQADVMPVSEIAHFPRPLRSILDWYAIADTLASHFQSRTLLTLRGLLVLSILAAIFFQLYSHVETKSWGLSLPYLGALGVAYAWYLWAKRRDYENKYLDYRALAEGLRVQLFWRLAGLRHSVADHYLRKQKGELDWIRQALRVWNLRGMAESSATDAQPPLKCTDSLPLILRHWVENQYAYFSKAALRDQMKSQRIKKISYAFFMVGIAMGVIKVLFSSDHLILVVVGTAVIIAALLFGYAKSRALSEHAKQYGRMAIIFANARGRLEESTKAGQYTAAAALIEELGKEALVENGDWVLLHRERPLQLPKA